jgi:hypothetical protein
MQAEFAQAAAAAAAETGADQRVARFEADQVSSPCLLIVHSVPVHIRFAPPFSLLPKAQWQLTLCSTALCNVIVCS